MFLLFIRGRAAMAAPGRTSIYDFASILGVEKQKISTFILAHLTVTGNEAASFRIAMRKVLYLSSRAPIGCVAI
jgi:hypothetical protein